MVTHGKNHGVNGEIIHIWPWNIRIICKLEHVGIQTDAEKRMKKARQEQRFAQSPGSLSLVVCVCVSSIPSGPTRPQNNLPVANDFPVPPTKTYKNYRGLTTPPALKTQHIYDERTSKQTRYMMYMYSHYYPAVKEPSLLQCREVVGMHLPPPEKQIL